MREKWFALLLSGVLAMGLLACASGGDNPSPYQTPPPSMEAAPSRPAEAAPPSEALSLPPETDTPDTSPEPGDSPLDSALPRRAYEPWQEGYMDFLTALLRAEEDTRGGEAAFGGLAADERGVKAFESLWETMEMGSENYSLYDVDGDGVPELFVKYGNCEAAFTTQCYTWRDSQVVCIGEFHSGHSSLYACPGKSALLVHYGQMGYAELCEYPMEGGRLAEEQVLFSEEDVWEYTGPDEIVPGAQAIGSYDTELCRMDFLPMEQERPSAGKALLLPISDYYGGPAATGSAPEQARRAILAALSGETQLCGVSGDHFYGDVGWTTWEEYVQPGVAYPRNRQPFQIVQHAWQDLNGDGQEECVLWLEAGRGGAERPDQGLAALSEQGGTVYAYYFGFYGETELGTDGVFRHVWGMDGCDRALSFWGEQCYEYGVRSASAGPVKWLDGSPAE